MKNIYYAHIHSHLMYGLVIWGSTTSAKNIKKLVTIQNSCLRVFSGKPKWYSTRQLYKEERLLQLESLIQIELCKFGHRITHRELPKPLLDLVNSWGGRKTHPYETHNKNLPSVQQHTGTSFNKSFMCKGITEYNRLPLTVWNTSKVKLLVSRLKTILMN